MLSCHPVTLIASHLSIASSPTPFFMLVLLPLRLLGSPTRRSGGGHAGPGADTQVRGRTHAPASPRGHPVLGPYRHIVLALHPYTHTLPSPLSPTIPLIPLLTP
jgi:hypothetical protein